MRCEPCFLLLCSYPCGKENHAITRGTDPKCPGVMGSSIEEVARSWLADPAWQKVFKHTFDVVEDYVSYVLVALGAISLSVKLLTTLSTGDLGCNSMQHGA